MTTRPTDEALILLIQDVMFERVTMSEASGMLTLALTELQQRRAAEAEVAMKAQPTATVTLTLEELGAAIQAVDYWLSKWDGGFAEVMRVYRGLRDKCSAARGSLLSGE